MSAAPLRRRQRARRPSARKPLTRDRVLRVAIQLADKGGIASLSMRKLAKAVRVEAMSLYNHVANRDDLLDGMVDSVVAEIEAPTIGGDWKAAMRRRAVSAHAVLKRHPWSITLLMSRITVGPAMLRYVDATVGCLRKAGFSFRMIDHAWNAVDNHVYGFTLQELNLPVDPEEYASTAKHFLPMIPEEQYPYMREMTLQVIDGKHDGLLDFHFGLDLILDGLEQVRLKSR